MIEIEDARELAKTNSGLPDRPYAPLTVGQLELALLSRFPREDAEDWDRMGMLAGDPATLVTGVAVALDPTPEAVRAAADAGANVLLTHHPAFLDPPEVLSPSFEASSSSGVVAYLAVSLGVALVNIHTALDASVEATRMYPRMLNLEFVRLLEPLQDNSEKGYGILCRVSEADAPFKLGHLAARATSVFGRPPRVWGDSGATIRNVVVGNGSASSLVDACLAADADCLLCGEIRYHSALEASSAGLAVVEVGHDVSEFPLCALLAQSAVEAGVSQDAVTMVDQSANWSYPDATRL